MSLQEVLQSSALAEAVFKALAMRERFRQVTDLRRLYNEVDKLTHGNADPNEFNRVIQNMEKAGLGRFVAGRKNNPDRFKWADKSIAKNIKEGKLESIPPEAPKVVNGVSAGGVTGTPTEMFHEAIGVITKQGPISYINVKIPINIPLESLQAFITTLKTLKA